MSYSISIKEALCSCKNNNHGKNVYGPWEMDQVNEIVDSPLPKKFENENIILHCVEFRKYGYDTVRAILSSSQYGALSDQLKDNNFSIYIDEEYTTDEKQFIEQQRKRV